MSAASFPVPPSRYRRDVPVPGGVMALYEWGGGRESEVAIVLLHGFTGSHESWEEVVRSLRLPRRIVAVDLPGHGETKVEAASMEETAAALESALAAAGVSRPALVGYSMGGRVALYYALTRAYRVERLVLESASPGIATEAERVERRRSDEELARFAHRHGVAEFVRRWEDVPVLSGQRRLPAQVRRRLREQRLRCSAAGLAASLRAIGAGNQPWLGDRLAELDVPVLLVAGAEDDKFAGIARSMAERLPQAQLRIIADAGHTVHLERPEQLARLLADFISGGGTPATE